MIKPSLILVKVYYFSYSIMLSKTITKTKESILNG